MAKKEKIRRVPKVLSSTLYCYVEPGNYAHAKGSGAKLFGSHSAYVNALIAKDRGVKPALGFWKAKGEAKKRRLAKTKKVTIAPPVRVPSDEEVFE